jgi:hypothetical protein
MSQESAGLAVVVLIICVIVFSIYLAPSIVAFAKNHPNRWVILVLNLLFGVTLFGWFLLLLWSMRALHQTSQVNGSHGGESGLNLFANDIKRVNLALSNGVANHQPKAFSGTLLDKIAKLERLMALHKSGALSEAEFLRMKSEVV